MIRSGLSSAYLRLLTGILLLYVLIIGFGNSTAASPVRILLLGYLAVTVARRRFGHGLTWGLVASSAALFVLVGWATLAASPQVTSAVVGSSSLLLTAFVMATIARTLVAGWRVDTATVLGVLCIYLLFALLFASLHQLLAAFNSDYVRGALTGEQGRPSPADLLYFSVITITTVGFGDITPASEPARAVAVTEALVGQLYLVSVVAIVVSGWRRGANHAGRGDAGRGDAGHGDAGHGMDSGR